MCHAVLGRVGEGQGNVANAEARCEVGGAAVKSECRLTGRQVRDFKVLPADAMPPTRADRLHAGFFGGEGFILQRLEGTGDVFIHSGGTIIPMDLKAGEKLRVDTGCLVAFDPTVDYDIEMVGGIKWAGVHRDNMGRPEISFLLDSESRMRHDPGAAPPLP